MSNIIDNKTQHASWGFRHAAQTCLASPSPSKWSQPLRHLPLKVCVLDERLVNHLDHEVAAVETLRGHEVVQLRPQLILPREPRPGRALAVHADHVLAPLRGPGGGLR